MKAVVFIPFAFIAGDHGFAIFAPYVAFMVAVLLLTRWRARLIHPTAATGAGQGSA